MDEAPTTSIVDVPPTAAEIELQGKVDAYTSELRQARKILTADELVSLVAPRARLETAFASLADSSRNQPWMFSIDGVLGGQKLVGALFAGEAILVYAPTLLAAQDLANRGLRSTIDLIYEEYQTRETRLSDIEQGTQIVGAGRNARDEANEKFRHENPFLVDYMAHAIGGLPWKG